MTSTWLVSSVSDQLIPSTELSTAQRNVADITILWIDEVAKELALQNGWSSEQLTDPSAIHSNDWLKMLQKAMSDTAWVMYSEFQSKQITVPNGTRISESIAKFVATITPLQARVMLDFEVAIKATGESIANVGEAFWARKEVRNGHSGFGYSAYALNGHGQVEIAFAHALLDRIPSGWTEIFSPGEATQLNAWSARLTIDNQRYDILKSQILEHLGKRVNSIVSAQFDG